MMRIQKFNIQNSKFNRMNFTLKIWRQENARAKGRFETYPISNISPDCSFLEMLDLLNESLVEKFEMPISFEHDCAKDLRMLQPLHQTGVRMAPTRA